jgi:hypothetical protein
MQTILRAVAHRADKMQRPEAPRRSANRSAPAGFVRQSGRCNAGCTCCTMFHRPRPASAESTSSSRSQGQKAIGSFSQPVEARSRDPRLERCRPDQSRVSSRGSCIRTANWVKLGASTTTALPRGNSWKSSEWAKAPGCGERGFRRAFLPSPSRSPALRFRAATERGARRLRAGAAFEG